ncbi:hypothetical protein ACH5RR_022800 [Cinchona calisaya]|uniref:Uncharacterized protein n=1 Tax=Cinchona calisaya TaxID=153742 RepID=A0ABD2ZDT6_9GENT
MKGLGDFAPGNWQLREEEMGCGWKERGKEVGDFDWPSLDLVASNGSWKLRKEKIETREGYLKERKGSSSDTVEAVNDY